MNKNEKFVITVNRELGSGGRTVMEAETVLTTASMIGTEQRILQDLAAEESCVVAGRSGFLVFREWPNHVNVFIQAPMESRIQRVMSKQQLSREEAIAAIEKVDKGRETYIKKYVEMNPELRSSLANISRYDTRNYDLVINMDGLTEDDAVEVIMSYIDRTNK